MYTGQSEVAQLLERICAEYEAGRRGLSGLATGTAKHDFIEARTINMGRIHDELTEVVGDPIEAIALIVEALEQNAS